MRRYILILLTILWASCGKTEIDDSNSGSSREDLGEVSQTTIMYFMGTSLKSFFSGNISDANRAVANGALGSNGRFVIFMPSTSGAELYELYESGGGYVSETIATFTTNESLDESRIVEVIAMAQEHAPAESYNLILSGHGSGWVLSDHPYLKSVGLSSVNWERELGVTRFMGSSSDGYMEVKELRSALEATSTKFGCLLFDMCLMSNIETLYELKDLCDNVIASPCEVMGDGFPYDLILSSLYDKDFSDVCYQYYNSYVGKSYASAAVAMCVTAELDDLADVVRRINEAGVNDVDIDDLQCYERLSKNVFCDMGNYMEEACGDESLLEEFNTIYESAFPLDCRYHTSSFYSDLSGSSGWVDITYYTGVSTSAPSEMFRDDWAETSWSVATTVEVEEQLPDTVSSDTTSTIPPLVEVESEQTEEQTEEQAEVEAEEELLTTSRNELGMVDQTTIMYFMGTTLRGYFSGNVTDVKSAISTGALGGSGRFFVFMPSSSGAELYELYVDEDGSVSTEMVTTYSSKESLSESRIVDVVAQVQAFAPSQSYNLICCGHGSGWVSSTYPNLRSVGGDYVNWEKELGVTRCLGSSLDGYLEVSELRSALESTSVQFGYILFDMCFMSNVETLYELKGVCDRIIASPCEVMVTGFPYDEILASLYTADFGDVCYKYYSSYLSKSYPSAAVAICVTAELDGLASVVKRINEAGVRSVDIAELQCYERLDNNVYCDLGDYIDAACEDESLLNEFESAMERAFPSEGRYHTASFYTDLTGYSGWVDIDSYTGVSTSAPSVMFRDEWASTSWAKATM